MTGYRVKLAGKYINEESFMLTYGDAVADININELVAFSKKQNTIGTVTGVYPPSRFGDLKVNGDSVKAFKEKAQVITDEKMINGGFFVFKKEFLDTLPDDAATDLEKDPLENLVKENQLSVYRHKTFWQCMDTYRDYEYLNKLWKSNPAWKLWNE